MSAGPASSPFDDFRALVRDAPPADADAVAQVRARDARLTKPPGSLGQLERLAEWLAAWQRRAPPLVERPLVAVFAASHGVTAQGVSAFPAEVTRQMVDNFGNGGAAINQICTTFGLGLRVFDLAVDIASGDITIEDAFSDEKSCAATMAYGMEAIHGVDLVCLGEMGIGNTTVASAVLNALYGGSAGDWCGRGTGVDDAGLARKVAAVEKAVARIGFEPDPLKVLQRVGGREIAAMVGAILAARHQNVPVIVDGFVTTAAAAVAAALGPGTIDHCLFAHRSAEAAHRRALQRLGVEPLLDLGLRLGEGTGAALAAALAKAAADLHNGMATFDAAGVSDRV